MALEYKVGDLVKLARYVSGVGDVGTTVRITNVDEPDDRNNGLPYRIEVPGARFQSGWVRADALETKTISAPAIKRGDTVRLTEYVSGIGNGGTLCRVAEVDLADPYETYRIERLEAGRSTGQMRWVASRQVAFPIITHQQKLEAMVALATARLADLIENGAEASDIRVVAYKDMLEAAGYKVTITVPVKASVTVSAK